MNKTRRETLAANFFKADEGGWAMGGYRIGDRRFGR
jgi:hypothetical protein